MMEIRTTDKLGVTVGGKFREWSDYEDRDVEIDAKHISWATLRSAAKQDDSELAGIYAELLAMAEKLERKRLVSEDWKTFGYPLMTGFDCSYNGQIVMRAWEIRRVHGGTKDIRVAYIVTYDRSDNSMQRKASPEFPDVGSAEEWLTSNYGGWHEQVAGQDTANIWFAGYR